MCTVCTGSAMEVGSLTWSSSPLILVCLTFFLEAGFLMATANNEDWLPCLFASYYIRGTEGRYIYIIKNFLIEINVSSSLFYQFCMQNEKLFQNFIYVYIKSCWKQMLKYNVREKLIFLHILQHNFFMKKRRSFSIRLCYLVTTFLTHRKYC